MGCASWRLSGKVGPLMAQFLRIALGVNVLPLALELHRAAHLWDEYPMRRTYPGTPHAQMTDIFVRFRPREEIAGPESHNEQYRNVFWPAWRELPSLRPLVFNLMAIVQAVELGSILVTRLPPGGKILPHNDGGHGWAPEFYNTKAHLTVAGRSLSRCGGEEVEMLQGECWTFDNLVEHSLENPGPGERIVVIISMRCEP